MSSTLETTASGLPAEFADLEPFAAWILPTQGERYQRRITVPMDEMQAFYDVAFPRLPDIIEYVNQYELGDLPEPVQQLMYLTFGLIEASFPVEIWRQGRVPDSGAASIDCVVEPGI